MPGSTPASATGEPGPGVPVPGASAPPPSGYREAPVLPARRRPLARLVRTRAGAVGLAITAVLVLVAVLAPLLAPADPLAPTGAPLAPPSAAHPMGTDGLGRDVLSGVLYGTRTSLYVAAMVCALALVLGTLVGTVSGYRGGGLVDDALMRLTELFQVLPRFFLAIVVLALFGPGLDRLVLVLGLTSWAILARVIRAEVLSLRERAFVEAARASGASAARIIVRELLPNALPAGIVLLGLVVAQVILLEASLGFLGLGDPNIMSWGYLAGQAQRFLRVAWWLSVFPGAAIIVAVLGLNLLADAFNDVLAGRR
jgi:peptide/nickel transport system permease protein